MTPETRYARSGDVNIAYQVVGDAPRDLVLVPGWVSNIEVFWEEPACARFLERLASFTRLILFDKRGTGLSDRVSDLPNLETRMDDVRAVHGRGRLRAGGALRLLGGRSRCARSSRPRYPARTTALIMPGATHAGSGHPITPGRRTPEPSAGSGIDAVQREWGGPVGLDERGRALPGTSASGSGGRGSSGWGRARRPPWR